MAGTHSVFVVVWAYRIKPGAASEFEHMYGVDGGWARLFRGADGFLATELWRDVESAGRYLTIDRWRSRRDYERFRQGVPAEYAELDAAGAALTESEERIAAIELVAPVS